MFAECDFKCFQLHTKWNKHCYWVLPYFRCRAQDSSDAGSAERTHRVCVLSAESRSQCGDSGPLGQDSAAPWGGIINCIHLHHNCTSIFMTVFVDCICWHLWGLRIPLKVTPSSVTTKIKVSDRLLSEIVYSLQQYELERCHVFSHRLHLLCQHECICAFQAHNAFQKQLGRWQFRAYNEVNIDKQNK